MQSIIGYTGHILVIGGAIYVALMAAFVFFGPDEPSGLFYDETE